MAVISTVTGQQSANSIAFKQQLFVVPGAGTPAISEETPIWRCGKNPPPAFKEYNISCVNKRWFDAGAEGKSKELGRWCEASYNVPDGTVLKLFAWKMRTNPNDGITTGSLLLIARATGPLIEVTTPLLPTRQLPLSQLVTSLRGDVLPLDEAKQAGVRVPPMYRQSYTPSAISAMFRVRILEEEIAAKPTLVSQTVIDEEGRELQVATRGRKRRITL